MYQHTDNLCLVVSELTKSYVFPIPGVCPLVFHKGKR